MQSLAEFVEQVDGFSALSHAEKIKHFAWYLQEVVGTAQVTVANIRACYERAHLDSPRNLPRSMDALCEKKPPDLLKSKGSYRLYANQMARLNSRYGKPESTVAVEQVLTQLPAKIPNESERLYLEETLTCYRHHAFRATIVMAWNLAYSHLLSWILADATRLALFNQGIAKRNPKKAHVSVNDRSHFEDLKEDEVIDIAGNLSGITGNMKKTLKEKLGRRNTYAHPSTMEISKPQVDDMVTDLVNNIVLQLP